MMERKSRLLLKAVRKDKLVEQLKIQNINWMLYPQPPPLTFFTGVLDPGSTKRHMASSPKT